MTHWRTVTLNLWPGPSSGHRLLQHFFSNRWDAPSMTQTVQGRLDGFRNHKWGAVVSSGKLVRLGR